ncbi:MAG: ABC transporter permease [Chloroflexi bacterium]|nr:ABC transporter permease [Chloroflexota bacterium]
MAVYVARRLLYIIPSLILASFITFAVGFYGPGDPLKAYMGQEMYNDVQARERLRRAMGLDRPFYIQYGEFLTNLLRGDLGISIISRQSIGSMISSAWPISIQLGLVAMVMWFVLGISLGVIAAISHNSLLDYIIVSLSVSLSTIPPFVLGPMLMILFILQIPLIKGGIGWEGIFSQNIILPAIVIAASGLADLVRQTRASILETIGEDYVRTAHAKGLPEQMVIMRHVMRNAFTPILTITGAAFSGFITGSLFAERIFNIHGFGWLTYDGIVSLDYRLLVVVTTFSAALIMAMNLVVDLLYGVLDPRVRIGK